MTSNLSLTDIKDTFINTLNRNKEIITGVVTGASETTRLVITATNNEQWGPTGPQMRSISDLTFNYSDCTQIMEAIWERLETNISTGANWRNIYKSLLLLDYIIRNGSERVVNEARQNIYQIKSLSAVHFVDADGVDRGLSIRERSKQVVDLLGDTNRLREERKKCKQNRDKYSTAYGNESYDRPYGGRYGSSFDDDEFPTRPTKTSFNITEDDFKDDFKDDYKSSKTHTPKDPTPKIDDEFGPFPSHPPAITQSVSVKPSIPAADPSPINWDPFSATTPVQNPGNNSSTWDDFNPRETGTTPSTNPLNAFSPISESIISSQPIIGSTIPGHISHNNVSNPSGSVNHNSGSNVPINHTGLSPNIFGNPVQSNPVSNPTPKLHTASSIKSNDPWAASHLYNLSNNPTSPRSNSVNTGTAKPLGATVGSGWPNVGVNPGTTTGSVPVSYVYPPTVSYSGVPVTYTSYPGTNPSFTSTPVNYSNTSQWGI